MDSYFMDLYRTRLYLPLTLLLLAYWFIPSVRKAVAGAAEWIDHRKTWVMALVCAAVSFCFCVGVIYQGKSWGGDFSQYFAQARAIVTGTIPEWYERNIFIIDNSCVIGADVYPWMWALMIAPIYAIFHSFPIMLLKVYEAALMATGSAVLVYFMRRRLPLSRAVFLSCFVLWNYVYIMDVNATDADLVSFFWGIVALNFVDLYLVRRRNLPDGSMVKTLLYGLCSGAAICGAVMTKTLCIGLLLALLAYDVVCLFRQLLAERKARLSENSNIGNTRQRVWIRWIIVALMPYVSYKLCMSVCNYLLLPSGGSYKDYFTFSGWRFSYGIQKYYEIFQWFFGSGVRPIISVIVCVCGTALLILTVIGIITSVFLQRKERELYYGFYVCGMILMLLFYDYYRAYFVLTFYPLMILFAYYAMQWLVGFVGSRCGGGVATAEEGMQHRASFTNGFRNICWSLAMVALLLTLAQSLTAVYAVHVKGYNMNEVMTEDAQETFAYIRENVDSDKVVYFLKPRVLYLYTDVYSFYWDDDNPDRLELADYVLMSVYNTQDNIQNVLDHSGEYEIVFQNDRFTLYQKN